MAEEIKYFTQKEVERVFKVIEEDKGRYILRNLCIFRVGYRCGLRASEIGMILVENFNPVNKTIYCKRLKGSLNTTVKVDDKTTRLLNKHIKENRLKEEDVLFQSMQKKPIDRKTLDGLSKKYCKLAKIQDKSKWHFHSLKHSICVHLAEAGADIKEIQQYVGHKNINNTLIYFQFTTRQLETMYRKIENSGMLVE